MKYIITAVISFFIGSIAVLFVPQTKLIEKPHIYTMTQSHIDGSGMEYYKYHTAMDRTKISESEFDCINSFTN